MSNSKLKRLEEIFEAYNGLISNDELLQRKLAKIEAEREKTLEEKEGIYGEMAHLQEEIRELLKESQQSMKAPEETKAESKPEPDHPEAQPPKAGKRKRVDLERAKEMHAAGWSYAKIGKELGVSTQSVHSALNRKKKTELTEEEERSCEQFAEELFGGGK